MAAERVEPERVERAIGHRAGGGHRDPDSTAAAGASRAQRVWPRALAQCARHGWAGPRSRAAEITRPALKGPNVPGLG